MRVQSAELQGGGMPHSLPESILTWVEIKEAVPVMLRAGVSTIGMLAWSQGRSHAEVRTGQLGKPSNKK